VFCKFVSLVRRRNGLRRINYIGVSSLRKGTDSAISPKVRRIFRFYPKKSAEADLVTRLDSNTFQRQRGFLAPDVLFLPICFYQSEHPIRSILTVGSS